jgi:hypothetical protein
MSIDTVNSSLNKNIPRIRSVWLAIAAPLVLALLATPLRTQQNSCAQIPVFVSVEDGSGKPFGGLTAASFHASIGREPASVTKVEPNPPSRILILFDLSTSMHNAFVVKSASLVAVNLIQRSKPDVQFGFSTFSDKFEVKEDFTYDHQNLIQRIIQDLQNSPQRGASAVYDSAVAATTAFKTPQLGDAVLMFTDGDDNFSALNSVEATVRIAASHVRLFTVSLTSDASGGELPQHSVGSRNRFADVVEGAGGEVFYLGREYPSKAIHPKRIEFRIEKDYSNAADAADGILRNMATGYLLQISPATEITKPQDWKLDVIDSSGGRNSTLFVRYQPKFYACAAASNHK